MQWILFIASVALGLGIAAVDSLPKWDDTGITVVALLVVAAFVGFFVRRRPWVYGLALGLWIPLRGIIMVRDLRFLFVLLIPLVGVYAGRGISRLARGSSAPA